MLSESDTCFTQMADRFFTPDALSIGDYTLKGSEAHHLSAVRRFGPGDQVILFNGDGCEYPAQVISVGKKSAVLHITSTLTPLRELNFPLIVSSALPKGDRADFLVEKLTELGVSRFIPLITERSIVRPKETIVEKYRRAVIEASKQCGRNKLMEVESPCNWDDLLKRNDLPRTRFLLHTNCTGSQIARPADGVVAAIGPEGGFAQGEIESALAIGWQTICLGPRVLRVETAALAAATLWSVG
jgi:16S rRNA (uracil1498-N3)-methyltransferase